VLNHFDEMPENLNGSGDLYISYKTIDRTWNVAQRLPEPINSKYMDYCPYVSDNILYFTSRRSEIDSIKFFKTTDGVIIHIQNL